MAHHIESLLVSLNEKNCGVYQYGELVADTLGMHHIAVSSVDELALKCFELNPKTLVWNWHPATLYAANITPKTLKNSGFKSAINICLMHEFDPEVIKGDDFDATGFSDPSCGYRHEKFFRLPRIVPEIERGHLALPADPVIGSFGVGLPHKGYDRVAELTKKSFTHATIRLHIPRFWAADPDGANAARIVRDVMEIVGPNYRVEHTDTWLSRNELISWLSVNTINLLPYPSNPHSGISSSTDLAIACGRPFGITRSGLFKHLHHLPINVDACTLEEIINLDPKIFEELRQEWSPKRFREEWTWMITYTSESLGSRK